MKLFGRFVHHSPYLHPLIKVFIRYRYVIFGVFAFFIWADFSLYSGKSLVGLYSLIMVFLGMIYFSVKQGIFNSLLVTLSRYFISPNGLPEDVEIFLFQWLSYFAIWFAVSALVNKYIEQQENVIRLTTTLAKTLDSRDKYTAFHSANVARYSKLIAKEMGLTKKACREIKLGAELHDIGKIGIPENILRKPGKLTEEEYELIKTHTTIGYEMVKHINVFEKTGVLDAILYHHEREDGSGYPKGLKGEEIPMVAKVIAVADSFDAMTSNRIYREENRFEFAVNEIVSNKGKYYDPQVVDSFCRIIKREGEKILELRSS